MYFIYTEKVYSPGETWDGQTITNVWSGDDVLHQQYQTTWHLTVGNAATTAVFDRSFQYARPTSLIEWFYECEALTSIKGLEYLNTSEVTNTKFMFCGAWLLTELDLTGFDMSKVEDATYMFFDCSNLTTIYCNDTWDIPVTEDMFFYDGKLTSPAASYDRLRADGAMANPDTGYFTRCKLTPQAFYCSGDKTLYFTNTKVPYKVGDRYNGQTINLMWRNDSVLNAKEANEGWLYPAWWYEIKNTAETVSFELPFRTARPISTQRWFADFTKLAKIKNIENLNTSEVGVMMMMFDNCSLPEIDLNHFDVSKVYWTQGMFTGNYIKTIYCDNDWSEILRDNLITNNADHFPLFYDCYNLKGAVGFNDEKTTYEMANPYTGYFTKRWPIHITIAGNGTVTADDDNPYCNFPAKITVHPDVGYGFYGIVMTQGTLGDNTQSPLPYTDNGDGSFSFTMPAKEVFVDVWFTPRTAQALWCEGNSTLSFVYPPKPFAVGDTYDGQTVTALWSGEDVTDVGTATPGWSAYAADVTRVVIDSIFCDVRPTSLNKWFCGMTRLSEIVGLENLNTSQVEFFKDMFADCKLIQTFDLNHFVVGKDDETDRMFSGCDALTTIYCANTWNLKEIYSRDMFSGCTSLLGAIAFDAAQTDGTKANPDNGYFTKQWTVTANVEHCTFEVSDSVPFTNQPVTIAFSIDEPYRLTGFTVTGNTSGNEVALTDNGDGTYSFTMPAENVTVGVTLIHPEAIALWCEGNSTLYFDYDYAPAVGDTHDGQVITNVWSGTEVTDIGWETPGWYGYRSSVNKVVFSNNFSVARPTSLYYWFCLMNNLEQIVGLEFLNTSEVTNMNSTFYGCAKLTTLDLNTFDVSKVTNSSSMFRACSALTTIYCDNTWEIETSDWMFFECENLKGAIEYAKVLMSSKNANPINGYFTGKWDITVDDNIEHGTVATERTWAYTNEMVTLTVSPDEGGYGVYKIIVTGERTGNEIAARPGEDNTYSFQMPAEAVTVSAVIEPDNEPFVVWCYDTKTLYFDYGMAPLVGDTYMGETVTEVWSGSHVDNTANYVPNWHQPYAERVVFKPSFAAARPNGCASWFQGSENLTEIEGLEYLNTSEVTTMNRMFNRCISLGTLDLNTFDMTNVTDVSYMFFQSNLQTIYCDKTWDIPTSDFMFSYNSSLEGAVRYNSSNSNDCAMANPKTGYFTGKWNVNIPKFEHGRVECEKETAYTNETVTITVIPEDGYTLESLTVTATDGEQSGAPMLKLRGGSLDVTPGDEPGTYTFKMSPAPVTISAVFAEDTATGISGINADNANREVRYYDLNGRYIGTTLERAPHGIYVTGDGKKIAK
ncbi:MAG: BspA family leucine-rich repeat surface protein [Muribaculaceae bacterium]|nr:BspA family leucine-rich repeat surface protein [Muribaculaceae bacterium]